jgi:hypothetical protein
MANGEQRTDYFLYVFVEQNGVKVEQDVSLRTAQVLVGITLPDSEGIYKIIAEMRHISAPETNIEIQEISLLNKSLLDDCISKLRDTIISECAANEDDILKLNKLTTIDDLINDLVADGFVKSAECLYGNAMLMCENENEDCKGC